jgi:hypothetical protein
MSQDAFSNRLDRERDERIQEEARMANDLQADYPEMTRTEALKIAARMVAMLKLIPPL